MLQVLLVMIGPLGSGLVSLLDNAALMIII